MRTLDKYEVYSDEYYKEVQRENAYVVYVALMALNDGINISDGLEKAIKNTLTVAEKEIGKREFTIKL